MWRPALELNRTLRSCWRPVECNEVLSPIVGGLACLYVTTVDKVSFEVNVAARRRKRSYQQPTTCVFDYNTYFGEIYKQEELETADVGVVPRIGEPVTDRSLRVSERACV